MMNPLLPGQAAQNMRPQGALPSQAQGNAYGRLGVRPPQAQSPITQMGQGTTPALPSAPMRPAFAGTAQPQGQPFMPAPAVTSQAPMATPAVMPQAPNAFGQQVSAAAQQLGGTMGDRDRIAQQQFLAMLRGGR